MVYGGKPSAGCQNCKKRKIKCDEARPACSQCIKSKRICPGYISHFDLVLRDQTESLKRKAERRKGGLRLSTSVASGSESSSCSITPSPGASSSSSLIQTPITTLKHAQIIRKEVGPEDALLLYPTFERFFGSPEHRAIDIFFRNFLLLPRHFESRRGFMELVVPLYSCSSSDSLLSSATHAVALVISGFSSPSRTDRHLAYTFFGKALRMTNLALQDPNESVKDETLVAVLLLGLFERIHEVNAAQSMIGHHNKGALTLVKHQESVLKARGQTRTDLSKRLLLAVYAQTTDSALQGFIFPEYDAAEWQELVSEMPQNSATRLTALSAKAAVLQAIAKTVLEAPTKSTPRQSIIKLMELATDIDALLTTWPDGIPETWYPTAALDIECPPERPRQTFVYEERIDIYYDLSVGHLWNTYRYSRIIVNKILLACISRIAPPFTMQLTQQMIHTIQTIQDLVDDVCASVPFHLGTKISGGPAERDGVEYPFSVTWSASIDHRRGAGATGGWNLLEPLRTCMKLKCLREGQHEWIRDQMLRIDRVYNLQADQSFLHVATFSLD